MLCINIGLPNFLFKSYNAYNVIQLILINNNVDFELNKIIQSEYLFNYQNSVTILSFPVFNHGP